MGWAISSAAVTQNKKLILEMLYCTNIYFRRIKEKLNVRDEHP